ncbi:NAD(P)-dependent oxidoreductase [Patescibacteria group bacterium]|nr:NAD(P)-dependent oxidoreductase [Patescibacteria group bacterium]
MNSFWKNKKVLIIGGTGFIGKNFVARLTELQANLTFTSRKKVILKNQSVLKVDPVLIEDFDAINEEFDVLINCAALDGNGNFKKQFANDVCDVNSRISLNILNFSKKRNIRDVVLLSSAEVYSGVKKKKVGEDDLKTTSLKHPSGYQVSKLFLEILSNFYSINNPEMRIYLPRPSYVYGPGDKYVDAKNSRLIPLLINNIKNGEKITFFGGRSRKINLIYAKDLVNAILNMVEKKKTGPLNITSTELLSVSKLIQKITEVIGKKAKVTFEKTNLRPGFLMNNAELLKIKDDFTPFEEGILETIKKTS